MCFWYLSLGEGSGLETLSKGLCFPPGQSKASKLWRRPGIKSLPCWCFLLAGSRQLSAQCPKRISSHSEECKSPYVLYKESCPFLDLAHYYKVIIQFSITSQQHCQNLCLTITVKTQKAKQKHMCGVVLVNMVEIGHFF